MSEARQWTLASAREMLGEVRERTGKAVEEVEALLVERQKLPNGTPQAAAADRTVAERVGRWAREMEALGADVKGPWLVDFDNGSGYFCWRWPEESLDYFHGYDEGFAGRRRIQ